MGQRPWLNVVAGLIVSVLLVLSAILMATTLFPHINVVHTAEGLAVAMLIAGLLAGVGLRLASRRRPAAKGAVIQPMTAAQKLAWRMPQLALLRPVRWSAGTKLGMLALRGYLVVGAVLLTVKAVQLGGG